MTPALIVEAITETMKFLQTPVGQKLMDQILTDRAKIDDTLQHFGEILKNLVRHDNG